MKSVILDSIIDSLKLLPFLFLVYLIMEFIEHKSSSKTEKIIKKSGKYGPFIGGLLGAFPQCGFSVMGSNLYLSGIITIGTLTAIFLSTSDEMLPILISNGVSIDKIVKIILIKIIIGVVIGFIVDLFIIGMRKNSKKEINKLCDHENCHCDENIVLSSIKHSLSIFIFILLVNISLNLVIYFIGEEALSNILISSKLFGPMLSSVIGLIPNCASSVIITQLYLNGALSFGSTIAGLLASSGLGILVLFRLNKNYKENFGILFLIYISSIVVGIIFNILNIYI